MRYVYRNKVRLDNGWYIPVVYPSIVQRDEHYSELTYNGVECKPLPEITVTDEEFYQLFGIQFEGWQCRREALKEWFREVNG